MRNVVMYDDIHEFELWPSKVFNKYLKITEEEVKRLIIEPNKLIDVSCPACNNNNKKNAFDKFDLNYVECTKCKTLYVSPRPSEKQISKYYSKSKSIDFWYSNLVKETLKKRTVHQSQPRAMWIANLTEEYFQKPEVFLSLNPISIDFLQEINNLNLFNKKIIYKPYIKDLTTFANEKNFKIIHSDLNEKINANAVSALGVIDRVFNPDKFLNTAKTTLIENGILFLTTSTISGFDLQILWDKSKNIFPPDRINLLSIEGLTTLFEKNGFEIIELSTPGQLDVELVKNAINENKDIELPRFISYLLNYRENDTHRSFQEFLQYFKLSSHVRIAARRK